MPPKQTKKQEGLQKIPPFNLDTQKQICKHNVAIAVCNCDKEDREAHGGKELYTQDNFLNLFAYQKVHLRKEVLRNIAGSWGQKACSRSHDTPHAHSRSF